MDKNRIKNFFITTVTWNKHLEKTGFFWQKIHSFVGIQCKCKSSHRKENGWNIIFLKTFVLPLLWKLDMWFLFHSHSKHSYFSISGKIYRKSIKNFKTRIKICLKNFSFSTFGLFRVSEKTIKADKLANCINLLDK